MEGYTVSQTDLHSYEAAPGVDREIAIMLSSTDPETIRQGLDLAEAQLPQLSEDRARALFEMVSALFFIDPLDRPDLLPVLEQAIALVAQFGRWVIPVLVQELEFGDVKAQMAIAKALGRMGSDAVDPLIGEYLSCAEPTCRAFVLYALGKIETGDVLRAMPYAIEAAASLDLELRDTATRAIGKFAEVLPPDGLPPDLRRQAVDQLRSNLSDPSPGVRAKAVRSLGKLARHGHLTDGEISHLRATFKRFLGQDEHFEWERAYVVRKEAAEALVYMPHR
jgi:HEAT repeat protein